jgi:hypothetical protein
MHTSVKMGVTFIGLGAIAAVASDNGQSLFNHARAEIRRLYDNDPKASTCIPDTRCNQPQIRSRDNAEDVPAIRTSTAKASDRPGSVLTVGRDPLDRFEDSPLASTGTPRAALDRFEETPFDASAAPDAAR